jgi:hypothetical protein
VTPNRDDAQAQSVAGLVQLSLLVASIAGGARVWEVDFWRELAGNNSGDLSWKEAGRITRS